MGFTFSLSLCILTIVNIDFRFLYLISWKVVYDLRKVMFLDVVNKIVIFF